MHSDATTRSDTLKFSLNSKKKRERKALSINQGFENILKCKNRSLIKNLFELLAASLKFLKSLAESFSNFITRERVSADNCFDSDDRVIGFVISSIYHHIN